MILLNAGATAYPQGGSCAALEDHAVQFDDDDAIDVDETIDQLTELDAIPTHSPVRAVQRAIWLPTETQATPSPRNDSPRRSSLIILPDDVALPHLAEEPPRARVKRQGPRARPLQLTSFAAKGARHTVR